METPTTEVIRRFLHDFKGNVINEGEGQTQDFIRIDLWRFYAELKELEKALNGCFVYQKKEVSNAKEEVSDV